jgi:hypothetical protein
MFKTISFQNFYRFCADPQRVKSWFPNMTRWEQMKRFFKVSDPCTDHLHKEDKMWRIREVFDTLIAASKANYWPQCEVALDEAIKKFKGRCSFKQYIKNKPVRWGIKIFALCCSHTAYLFNAIVYLGKRPEDEKESTAEGSKTEQAVISLVTPLQGRNHRLFMDNYYSSIPLFVTLSKMLIWATGTIRVNRKGLCREVTIKKNEETKLKKTPGYSRWSSYGALCYLAWFDKRPVHLLSYQYQPDDAGLTTVEHWYQAKKGEEGYPGKIRKEINCPPIVKFYNLFMGAVDLFDQFRQYIKLELRSRKFWHCIFWFVIESALVNSWVLYKATRQAANLPMEYDHLEFRRYIAFALAAEWEGMGCQYNPCGLASPTKQLRETKKGRRVSLKKNICNLERAFDINRHIDFDSFIPKAEGAKAKYRQVLCRQCKEHRTSRWCSSCKVPLCKGKCFLAFHASP